MDLEKTSFGCNVIDGTMRLSLRGRFLLLYIERTRLAEVTASVSGGGDKRKSLGRWVLRTVGQERKRVFYVQGGALFACNRRAASIGAPRSF
jgi:hypothetical protein